MRIRSVTMVGCAVFLLTLAGCPGGGTDAPEELVPAQGTVTLDGEPLAGASVMFGGVSVGETDANGHYELTYQGKEKGVPPGEHAVVIERWVMPDGSVYKSQEEMSPMMAGAEQQLPARYSAISETQLKATVPAGGGTIDFELTSEPHSAPAAGTQEP